MPVFFDYMIYNKNCQCRKGKYVNNKCTFQKGKEGKSNGKI
ncbi:hypothetical protein DEHRE_03305 [Dehalobacter restrictus DSM 9455]|uniref:Uncharacterized protein n=1 Tax=Dehalobacter restrictus (strain DSM 9455 / PER-K23) TaxID=871738 RepID=A0ABN4BV52_DEHRP|nr:hypothetical protein DEHRE_03305 [Dehalobacter restrictus DSM 9455]